MSRADRRTKPSEQVQATPSTRRAPAPQQPEHDGVGHVVASGGEAIGPCAFSSLVATREWLRTDAAPRCMRAYRRARKWLRETSAAKVAVTLDVFQRVGLITKRDAYEEVIARPPAEN
jgi:hypothetical protein